MSELLRGHKIEEVNGEWVYTDDKTPTNYRDYCGHCGKSDTLEGYDGCLGTIPNIMNACCGHGDESMAYIQPYNRRSISGAEAFRIQKGFEVKNICTRIKLTVLVVPMMNLVSDSVYLQVKEIGGWDFNWLIDQEILRN